MKILLFNCHTAYVYMLAKTGHQFFVMNCPGRPFWDPRQRPLPPNVILFDNPGAQLNLMRVGPAFFDRVIIQDTFIMTDKGYDLPERLETDFLQCPKIILFHNSFQTQFRQHPKEQWRPIVDDLKKKLNGYKKVFISEFKKKSFGMDGDVILPGVDIEEFGGWRGIEKNVLICLNNPTMRDFMNNTNKMRMVLLDLPALWLGEEDGKGILAPNFEELKNIYKNELAYLCLNNPEYEDGYNLSMLEFMATGGPVITLDHPTSPVKNGINGFKNDDLQEINKFLLGLSQEEAYKLGRGARKTVEENFNINAFVDNWNAALNMP